MENWLFAPLPVILKTIGTVALLFMALLLITRIGGLRTFADITSIDFASTIAIGSILGIIILNEKDSILKGAIAIGTVVALQAMFTHLNRKSDVFRKRLNNTPLQLMKDGKILHPNLKRVHLSEEALMAVLRKHNIKKLSEVKAAIFETTGEISVLHGKPGDDVDEIIMRNVIEKQ